MDAFKSPFSIFKAGGKSSNMTDAMVAEVNLQNEITLRLGQIEVEQSRIAADTAKLAASVLERIMAPLDTEDIDLPAGITVAWFPPIHRFWILDSIQILPNFPGGVTPTNVALDGVRTRTIPLVPGNNKLQFPMTSARQIRLTSTTQDALALIMWRRYTKSERVISGEDNP
jgi:hypothetical protein